MVVMMHLGFKEGVSGWAELDTIEIRQGNMVDQSPVLLGATLEHRTDPRLTSTCLRAVRPRLPHEGNME